MKVKLTVKRDAILLIANLLNKVYDLPVSNITQENIYKSISMDLSDKFDVKARNIKKTNSLLTLKNTSKLTIKFHEAWALQQVLHDILQIVQLNDYEQSIFSQFINNLDQKIR